MLQPKRVKYRKRQRARNKGQALRGATIAFGDYGLQALGRVLLTSRQIEAARRAITHELRRGGQIWIRVFPDTPVTSKPLEVRMGGGKAAVHHWSAVVKPGHLLFEIGGGVREDVAREAFRLASHKLPIPTRVLVRATLRAGES